MLVGAFRKVVIADSLLLLLPDWDALQPLDTSALALLGYLLGYAFALYNDFAGYTNLARGISGLFGIELSPNFAQPYFARSFTEFWNRWHITLSHWLRDYIYFPVARTLRRRFKSAQALHLILPPLVTMLVSGLWHNAGWNLLLWGALHGLYQVFEHLPALWRPVVPPPERPIDRQILNGALVFSLSVLAWLPFVMNLGKVGDYLVALTTWHCACAPTQPIELRLFLFIIPALALDVYQAASKAETFFLKWPAWLQAFALVILIALLALFSHANTQVPFIYQGF
jgi:D-alanyl-lipoteichoic acid acyltransferase DltB (MBOAT superfamily)